MDNPVYDSHTQSHGPMDNPRYDNRTQTLMFEGETEPALSAQECETIDSTAEPSTNTEVQVMV